jgi:hypothetical protein
MEDEELRFFAKMPEAIPIYEAVKAVLLDRFEGTSVKVQKSQIAFSCHKKFAYLWLPIRKMKGRPEVYLVLTFGLDHRIRDPRIVEAAEPYPKHWTHHVLIQGTSDLDEEVLGWLRQADECSRSGASNK